VCIPKVVKAESHLMIMIFSSMGSLSMRHTPADLGVSPDCIAFDVDERIQCFAN
jgi:hypothetical protein